jgi:hypothetical protein
MTLPVFVRVGLTPRPRLLASEPPGLRVSEPARLSASHPASDQSVCGIRFRTSQPYSNPRYVCQRIPLRW